MIKREGAMSPSQFPGPIAVIDLETTGLFPFRHDRVVEVAAVIVEAGEISREFVSIVNPARDIGPSRIHGLSSEDVLHAPEFGEIAGVLLDVLSGTVAVVGHNARFDCQFLESEFSRIGLTFPNCFWLCTMEMAWGGSLASCCRDLGFSLGDQAHCALADARATARLLVHLLADQPRTLRRLGELSPVQWPHIPRSSKRPVTREESRRCQAEPPDFLRRLLGRMQHQPLLSPADGATLAYGALLDRILEDRFIEDTEAEALLETAARWGLSGGQIRLIHHDYLNRLALAALADGVVTNSERRDLQLVARLLGDERASLDEILGDAEAERAKALARQSPPEVPESCLSGMSVCFTGELLCSYRGEPIARERAESLAAGAGLIVAESVTKKLDLLVVADPQTQSGKAKKARRYGIRVMHEPVFWNAIGVTVE